MENNRYIFSKLPSIQEIDHFLAKRNMKFGKEVRHQLQSLLSEIRRDIDWLSDDQTTRESILHYIKDRFEQNKQELVPLINGTGAIVHTNLGRSVFDRRIFEEIKDIATSYTNLEFSLETGKRGTRLSNVGNLLKTLTGAEEAVVVNNNAAAILLTLATLARGKEVIISRGELVEIGGSFRIPEVIGVSGAILREVGATNRTRIADYETAVSDQTAVLLKAHTSNYQITGFTESVSTGELANLAKKNHLISVEDLGSGALTDFYHSQLNVEPRVDQIIKDGIDVVTFSGDKLLGGPQAGIILGKRHLLEKIRADPLYRALRCDKLTTVLLEKTLIAYSKNRRNPLIPTQRMLNESEDQVKDRAKAVMETLDGTVFSVEKCESTPGGGSLPGAVIPSWGIAISKPGLSENRILTRLRQSDPPVIGRINDGKVILDCRTILVHQIETLQNVLRNL